MNAKIEKYAQISEIVGAVAVVISLIYVGISIRQNTKAVQVANHQALVSMDMEKNAWFRLPGFAEIYEIALTNQDSLLPTQLIQLNTFIADMFNAWEFAFITYQNGAMEEKIWQGWNGYYQSQLDINPFYRFWESHKSGFSKEFAHYIESVETNH